MWSKYVDTPYRFVQPALAVLNKRQEVVTAWSWSMSGWDFETNHNFTVELLSGDFPISMGAAPWLCTLQFGRLNEATAMLDDNVQFVHK
eukprot:gene15355-29154_t